MVYACVMEQRRYFNIEADSDDQVMDWLQTHSMQDVDNLTKDYTDEYEERICGYGDEGPGLKAHFDIRKEKETVTNKMARLQELINESKKIREDVKEETKKLQAEHLENRKAKYYKFCKTLKPYFELCKGFQRYQGDSFPNVFLNIGKDSKYEIRFEHPAHIGAQKIAHDGGALWIGRFDIRDDYSSSYYLDDLMDSFDEATLEENFAQMATDQLAKMAKETDDAYQDAKAKLESDREM